ncbi:sensory rhodopsin transducer [Microvirga sp. TS319]|uniref:sensory rhodopsin transducer n=1 Tax=Microvirga sp. TS319 TaxID=3241165 RepID=UPI003519EC20
MRPVGKTIWAIAEGEIASYSTSQDRTFVSHVTACILNAGPSDARGRITVFFSDRNPVGPYCVRVPAGRTLHLRFNDLQDPDPIPRDTDYASLFESDVPDRHSAYLARLEKG